MSCIGITGEVNETKQIEWQIPDFLSLRSEKGSYYKSPSFVFDNFSMYLYIYPASNVFSQPGFLSVYLKGETDCLHVNCLLHIKKADGTLTGSVSGDAFAQCNWGKHNFYDRSNLERNKFELLPSGILTIVCTLKHIQDGKQVTIKAEKVEMSTSEASDSDYKRVTELDILSDNLKDLSADKDSCDVVLEVQDKEFKAHKAILMARSSVFAAMFKHDTLEKQTGIIKISDCDSESFQEFLDYLYSGKLEDVSFRSAFHLYSTSNKYDVQKLKEFCIKHLMKSLSVDNMCDIVKLAYKYDETKLMTKIQEFFNENWCKIFPTTEWGNFITNDSRLANMLLVELSKSKSSQ